MPETLVDSEAVAGEIKHNEAEQPEQPEQSLEAVQSEAEMVLGQLEAQADDFIARAAKEGEAGAEAAQEMRAVKDEVQKVRLSFFEKLDAVIGISQKGRERKWIAEGAIPDNQKVVSHIESELDSIDKRQRTLCRKGTVRIKFDYEDCFDDQVLHSLAAAGRELKAADKKDNRVWENVYKKMGVKISQICERLISEGKLPQALSLYGALGDSKAEYRFRGYQELPVERIAKRILVAVDEKFDAQWKEFQLDCDKNGLSAAETQNRWNKSRQAYVEKELYGHPDLVAMYDFSKWNGSSVRQSDHTDTNGHIASLETLLHTTERDSLLSFFYFPENWKECVSEDLRERAFQKAITSNVRFLLNNYDVFKDKIDTLTGNERQEYVQRISSLVDSADLTELDHKRQNGHSLFQSEFVNLEPWLLSRIRLQPGEERFIKEALTPQDKEYKKIPVQWREHQREVDQTDNYNRFMAVAARYWPWLLYRNGDVLLGFSSEQTQEASDEQLIQALADNLLHNDAESIIFELYKHLRSKSDPVDWPFNETQTLRFTEYVLSKGERAARLVCAEQTRRSILSFAQDKAGLTEKIVDYFLEWGKADPLGAVLDYYDEHFQDIDPGREVKLIQAMAQYGTTTLKDRMVEIISKRGSNTELRPAAKALLDYTHKAVVFDGFTMQKYTDLHQRVDRETADAYVDNLNERAKFLVGAHIPTELRTAPEYMYFVRKVFPAGNYSNHKDNVACGDKLEHIQRYQFPREGYKVQLTGLLGYELRQVEQNGEIVTLHDDTKLLASYQERLKGIAAFVESRGPDNRELQKAFDAKVHALFVEKSPEQFKRIGEMSPKEEMLALFVGEAVRREKEKGYTPDTTILDLVVEYKYAYHEDLGAYVQRSAKDALRYKDETSQRAVLWQELSTIYGENVKHVLRHNIFEDLAASGAHYADIIAMFGELIGDAPEGAQLKDKQLERIRNTFDNDKITLEDIYVMDKKTGDKKLKPGKYTVLLKQVQDIFGANIKFKNDEERESCMSEMAERFEGLKESFTMAAFEKLIPSFFAIRQRYRFGINAKLEEMFALDLNAIHREFAKFDEKVEEEAKENRIGGPKEKVVKKSAKKRRITSYITKTQETANARMGAYLCIAGDQGMWENEHYFESVDIDDETGECQGLTMFLDIPAADGKKYLWFGPNPFESTLTKISAEQYLEHDYAIAVEFAKNNGYDGVVVPPEDGQILGSCTNRGGNFPDLIKAKRLRSKNNELKIVDFGANQKLGGSYGYEKGALIWQKKAAK